MYCSHCGNQIPDDVAFCPRCGKPVHQEYANPQGAEDDGQGRNEYPHPNPQHQAKGAASGPQPDDRKPVSARWPAAAGVMAVINLLFCLGAIALKQAYSSRIDFDAYEIASFVLLFAVPVLFFVPTKKLAFLTAIPVVLLLLLAWRHWIELLLHGFSLEDMPLQWVVLLALEVVLAVLYVTQMVFRPASAAMPVLYLLLAILQLTYSQVLLIVDLVESGPGYLWFAWMLDSTGAVFLAIAYIIAMFSSRRRKGGEIRGARP